MFSGVLNIVVYKINRLLFVRVFVRLLFFVLGGGVILVNSVSDILLILWVMVDIKI